MLAGPDTLEKLIPQREPMLMLDALISHEEAKTVSSFSIMPDNIFVQNGLFIEAGLIENMAQTAALHNGWKAMLENEEGKSFKPAIGVIGSIKNFVLSRLPEVNSLIETEVVIITEIFNASVLEAKVRSAGKMIAQCELKIFIQE